MSDNKLTEDKFLELINKAYAGFNFMHLKTTEVSYDERFDSAVCTSCKPFMQEICLCCSSAMSLLSLLNKSRDDAELEDVMTSISFNCVVYLVTCKKNIEWYVDNLVVCMTEESVGDLIDEYVRNMNIIFQQLFDIFNPYITFELHELIKQLEYALDNQDDIDDELVT
jgi:hypothetical protein